MSEIERNDLDAWEVEDLPGGFEDRVMGALEGAPVAAKQSRAPLLLGIAAAAVLVLGIAALVMSGTLKTASREEVARLGVSLDGGARAFPEPGARFDVEGATVQQTAGTVIYEVPEGAPLVVATPAGDVTVDGTKFEVEVMEMNEATRRRLMGAGVLAMGTIAVAVLVHEGDVVLANERGEVEVAATQRAFATDASAPARAGEKEPETKLARAAAPAEEERARKKRKRDEMSARILDALESRRSSSAPSADDEEERVEKDLGTLDKDYIRDVVKTQVIELVQECYQNGLENDPKMAGKIVLEFEIMGDESVGGVVDQVIVKDESTLVDPDMRECVAESMGSAIFDPPEGGGTVKVTYPMVFEVE